MNWEAIGAVAELTAAVGVIVTLAYLAVQVRQSTRAERSATQHAASSDILDIQKLIVGNGEVHDIWIRGIEAPSDLEYQERTRLFHLLFLQLSAYENFHYQYLIGALDDGRWAAYRVQLETYLASPGYQAYWTRRRNFFSPEFQRLIDSLDLSGDRARMSQLAELEAGGLVGLDGDD